MNNIPATTEILGLSLPSLFVDGVGLQEYVDNEINSKYENIMSIKRLLCIFNSELCIYQFDSDIIIAFIKTLNIKEHYCSILISRLEIFITTITTFSNIHPLTNRDLCDSNISTYKTMILILKRKLDMKSIVIRLKEYDSKSTILHIFKKIRLE